MAAPRAWLGALLLLGCSSAGDPKEPAWALSAEERTALQALRYDEAAPPVDPSNRVVGDAAAQRFGQKLFFEPAFSGRRPPVVVAVDAADAADEGDADGEAADVAAAAPYAAVRRCLSERRAGGKPRKAKVNTPHQATKKARGRRAVLGVAATSAPSRAAGAAAPSAGGAAAIASRGRFGHNQ